MKANNLGSFVLGPMAVDSLELSNVAATIADHGRWCEPTPVLDVRDKDGKKVPLKETPCEQALDVQIADALASGLSGDSHGNGTASAAARGNGWGGPMAAKTGTTETNFSAAFLGFTGDWAGSSYIFNDGGTPSNLCTGPVRQCGDGNLFGGSEPANIWFQSSNPMVDAYGGRRLPPFDPRFDVGTNPARFAGIASAAAPTPGPSRGPRPPAPPALPPLNLPNEWRRELDNFLSQLG